MTKRSFAKDSETMEREGVRRLGWGWWGWARLGAQLINSRGQFGTPGFEVSDEKTEGKSFH